jgi:hypothetical protein
MAKTMAREIAKKETNEVMKIDEDMFKGMDTGFEGTSSETFKTPFMKMLQAMSPELKPKDPEYVDGAKMGMFCNSATKELHEELNVVLLKVEHSLISWKPDRGGFAGRHNKSEEGRVVANQDGVQKWDAVGNDVIDTVEFFCMNADDPSDIFILSLSKASLKHAKSWATRVRSLKSDGKPVGVSWAGVWNITLMEESNSKGSWYTIGGTPKFERFITKDERDNFVMPVKEMLKNAITDYGVIENDEVESEVKY